MQFHTARGQSLLLVSLFASLATAQITPGNLCVMRVGDGALALTNGATAAFLDEYTPAGFFVQTMALPTAVSGANLPATVAGTATSEGFLSQSTDGRYLTSVGYAAVPGTAAIVATTSAAVPRVVTRIALDGTVDSSTSINNLFSAGNIRSATTEDGSQFWAAGSNSGVVLLPFAGTTGTTISTVLTNCRVMGIANGQLFTTSGAGTTTRCINAVGVGVPVATGQVLTILYGMTSGIASPYDYFFADAATVYVADDRQSALGGIQKWTDVAGTWTLQYTLNPATNIGCRGLSGFVENGVTTVFATTTNNLLVTLTDNAGAASTFTTLVTGAANTALRDVQFVRTPATATFSGTPGAASVGVPLIGTSGGAPVTGNLGFQITASNAPASTFVLFALKSGLVSPIGFPVPGTPACVLVYVLPDLILATIADPLGAASTGIAIPNNASLGGALIAAQVAAYDFSLVGFALPIGTSDAMQITIGN